MHIFRGKLSLRGQTLFAEEEEFTIIFLTFVSVGEPVFACWQWTGFRNGDNSEIKSKATCTQAGFIDSLYTGRDGLLRVGFCHGEDYCFDAISIDGRTDFTSLTVTTKEESSGHFCDPLSLVKQAASFTESPFAGLDWLIYLGHLSYQESVVDELLILVLPSRFEVGDRVCIYWQSGTLEDDTEKVNVNLECSLDHSNVGSEGRNIGFCSGDSHVFSGTISGLENENLTMAMEFSGLKTSLINLTQVFAVAERFNKYDNLLGASLTDVVSTVYNNTKRVAIVSIYNSGSTEASKNLVLAGLGLFLTCLGVPILGPGLASALYITSIAFGAAVMVDTVAGSGEAVLDIILFPGQSTFRVIPGPTFLDNDMSVELMEIDESGELVVQSASKGNLGTAKYNLSEYMPGETHALSYKELVRIGLYSEGPMSLEYAALLAIEGFQPDTVGIESTYNPLQLQKVPNNTILVQEAAGGTLKDFGKWTLSTGLKWDGGSNFFFMNNANLNLFTIISLPQLYRYVLRVPLYKVTSDKNNVVGTYQTEDEILQEISTRARPGMLTPSIRVASWNKTSGDLIDHKAEGEFGNMTVDYDKADSPYIVFLLIAAVRQFQRVVPTTPDFESSVCPHHAISRQSRC